MKRWEPIAYPGPDNDAGAATHRNFNQTTGARGSWPDAEGYQQNVIDEPANLVELSGLTLDENDDKQTAKAVRSQFMNFVAIGGTADALTTTLVPPITALAEIIGTPLRGIATANNTRPATYSVDGLTADLRRADASPLRKDDLLGNAMFTAVFDGVLFRIPALVPGQRTRLTANANYYVNPVTGSDANDGTTTGSAWATLNYAYSYLQNNLDAAGYTITINCAFPNNPTAYAQFTPAGGIVGVYRPEQLKIIGDTTNGRCAISGSFAGSAAIFASSGAMFEITGFTLANSGSLGAGIYADSGARVRFGSMWIGACPGYSITASGPGTILTVLAAGTITVTGNTTSVIRASQAAVISMSGGRFDMSGIAVSNATVSAIDGGIVLADTVNFAGTAPTGFRFNLAMNSTLDTAGAQVLVSTPYIPGTSNGFTNTGGQFQ